MLTVFVTLMMVPVVAITGLIVDVSRLKMYSSQAVMAADTYGAAVLSQFDHLLKELYGLFSVTQNEEGLAAIEEMKDYMTYSFRPDGDGTSLEGFAPYGDSDVDLVYENVEGASLSNNNVLMTQISDFMRFRIVEEVLDESGILNSLEQLDAMEADMDAVKERKKLTDSCQKALDQISEYYEILKKVAAYPDYLEKRETAYLSYSGKLTEIAASEEYDDYVYYLNHTEEVETALAAFGEGGPDTGEGQEAGGGGAEDEDLAEQLELYERFRDFDKEAYVEQLKIELEALAKEAANHDSTPIDFENAEGIINELGKKTDELEATLARMKEQEEQLREKLKECSGETREGIEEEIEGIEDIVALSGDFRETYDLILQHENQRQNQDNWDLLKEEVPVLDQGKEAILDGNAEPGISRWPKDIYLVWYDFQDDKGEFYRELQRLCESGQSGGGDKEAGDKEVDKANEAQKKAEEELNKTETSTARNIPDQIASELGVSGGSQGSVPNILDYFSGGMSFSGLSKAGTNLLDKFLVTSYDFGMFSSRVTGIKPPREEGAPASSVNGEKEEDGIEYSLTKIELSPEVNYLYGAELEYLFGGYTESSSNLNKTKNVICGVRMSLNFVSTYTIREINNTIRNIANAAANAVMATGVGAAAGPLVRIAVSGALRLAVASIETAADWGSLIGREEAVLFKTELEDLESIDALEGLLGIEISGKSQKKKLELSYEDYLYVLLCLLVDDDTLLSRTADLITLNVNQAKSGGDTLSQLDFRMSDTVTAVKATCKVRSDFVVVPENFAAWFYSNTDTETLIEVLEDRYFGYSVIRGY